MKERKIGRNIERWWGWKEEEKKGKEEKEGRERDTRWSKVRRENKENLLTQTWNLWRWWEKCFKLIGSGREFEWRKKGGRRREKYSRTSAYLLILMQPLVLNTITDCRDLSYHFDVKFCIIAHCFLFYYPLLCLLAFSHARGAIVLLRFQHKLCFN